MASKRHKQMLRAGKMINADFRYWQSCEWSVGATMFIVFPTLDVDCHMYGGVKVHR